MTWRYILEELLHYQEHYPELLDQKAVVKDDGFFLTTVKEVEEFKLLLNEEGEATNLTIVV